MFYTYILFSETHKRYYVGSTADIEQRLHRHNSKMVPSTKSYGPWTIAYSEKYPTRSEAVNREKQIKKMKSRIYIERLIENAKK